MKKQKPKMNQKQLSKIIEEMSYDEYRIYSLLPEDKNSKRNKSYLQLMTGYHDRTIKTLIRRLRQKGIPVCSQVDNGGGYWIEWDKKEFGRFIAQQKIELEGYKKSYAEMLDIYKSLEGDDLNELFI